MVVPRGLLELCGQYDGGPSEMVPTLETTNLGTKLCSADLDSRVLWVEHEHEHEHVQS